MTTHSTHSTQGPRLFRRGSCLYLPIGCTVWCTHLACDKGGLKAQCHDSPGQRPGLSKPGALRPVRAKDLFISYHSIPGPIGSLLPLQGYRNIGLSARYSAMMQLYWYTKLYTLIYRILCRMASCFFVALGGKKGRHKASRILVPLALPPKNTAILSVKRKSLSVQKKNTGYGLLARTLLLRGCQRPASRRQNTIHSNKNNKK